MNPQNKDPDSICQQWKEDLPAPDVGNAGTEIKEQREGRQSADCMFQHAVLTRLVPNFSYKLEVWALCPTEWMK